MKKIILIPPCDTYGDILSIIGLVYFLTNYYDKVYIFIKSTQLVKYYSNYFSECNKFNKQIFIINHHEMCLDVNNWKVNFFSKCGRNEYHICDTHSGSWNQESTILKNDKTDNIYYFNTENPIYNYLNVPEEYKCAPNTKMPVINKEINHIVYYKFIGLNNNVRMNFFSYTRNLQKEENITSDIKKKFGIDKNEKYNVVYNPDCGININTLVKNDYKTINIHNLVEFPGWLFTIIENAESIHLIEGNIVNFIYHCQYKNIINPKCDIYFYKNIRLRDWPSYNLDYAWKMLTLPILNNWKLID